jgi:cysteine desulfurase
MPETGAFLDSSSGEPMLPDARQAWLSAQESGWGDPARPHRPGQLAARALDRAREVVAAAVGARPDEVTFTTSGGPPSYAAVAGLARGRRRAGARIVTTAIDHSSVLRVATEAGEHVAVGVDDLGRLDLTAWQAAVRRSGTALAALQVGNHEVGTIQPYAAAIAAAHAAGVPVALDATAALGRIDLAGVSGWSVLTGWAGAFGGPASVGLLVVRNRARWRPPYPVDDYQGGRWPGMPDVPAIHAAAVALNWWLRSGRAVGERQRRLVDRLRAEIPEAVAGVDLAGDPVHRLPQLLTFSVLDVDGEALMLELDKDGFAVAAGSAGDGSSVQSSHVLAAMGSPASSSIRIGLTRTTTDDEIEAFLTALPPIVTRLRDEIGVA